jgi:hypothetical protein
MIDDLVDLLLGQKLPPDPRVTILRALLTPLRILRQRLGFLARQRPALLTSLRSIRRRRHRTVTRSRRSACLDPPQPILERPLPTSKIKQHLNNPLTPRIKNRLSL